MLPLVVLQRDFVLLIHQGYRLIHTFLRCVLLSVKWLHGYWPVILHGRRVVLLPGFSLRGTRWAHHTVLMGLWIHGGTEVGLVQATYLVAIYWLILDKLLHLAAYLLLLSRGHRRS